MGAMNASAWLLPAWRRSLETIGATADESEVEAAGRRLIERWNDQDRKHHNLRRLVSVLARVDELAAETHSPELVRVAAWYHGAVFRTDQTHVYTRRGGIDEVASADLARSELTRLGVPADRVERVVELIHSLARHHVPDGDLDAMALCDANLGGLAAEPQKYATYRREVREEYSHIPDEDYYRARLTIIDKLLARPKLFTSPLGHVWEERARENLGAERARVSAELAKLSAGPADAADHPRDARGGRAENPSFFAGQPDPAPRAPRGEPAESFAAPPPSPIRSQEPPLPPAPAAPDDDLRPLIKDYPKGRPLAPRVRRIDADPRTRELRLGDRAARHVGDSGPATAAPVSAEGSGERSPRPATPSGADAADSPRSPHSPEDGSTMTRPPVR